MDTTLKTMPKSVIGGNINFLQISAQSSEKVSSISFAQFSAIELLFEHIFCFFPQFSPFFCNRRRTLLSFDGHQLYNSKALPFTYGQYVVLELADKLYNIVTVCFCTSRNYVFCISLKQEPVWPSGRRFMIFCVSP
mgnify:CR=1 FL=1